MELAADADQRLVVYTAEPDSASEAGLRLLAGLIAEKTVGRADTEPMGGSSAQVSVHSRP